MENEIIDRIEIEESNENILHHLDRSTSVILNLFSRAICITLWKIENLVVKYTF